MEKSWFITFEGVEGCGKSTQVKMLADYFVAKNRKTTVTREPGGTEISEQIRSMLFSMKNANMSSIAELLLFNASRAQLVDEVIRPALKRGDIVICDRFYDSGVAYQGYGRGIDMELINAANSLGARDCVPDITFFIDLSPENAFKRKGGADADIRLEMAGREFFNKAYAGFKAMVSGGGRFVRIDANQTVEKMHEDILAALSARGVV